MPVTNAGARVIDPILTSVVQGYNTMDYVGGNLFPEAPVRAAGGQIIEFDRDAFRLYTSRRSPGSATRRIQFGHAGKPFALLNHRLEGQIPREHQRDASVVAGIDMGSRAATKTMKALRLTLEVEQAQMASTLANYPATNKVTLAGSTKWSTATGTPLADIDAGREAIRQQCGLYPTVLILSAVAFNACKNNPNVVARFQYNGVAGTDASMITPQMLAGLFNVKKVVVGAAVYWNDANVVQDIWGNNAILAFVPEGSLADAEEPSYGYTYVMEGHPAAEEPYWDNNTASWVYPVTFERAPVLSGITAGYLIQNPS
ncbi:MAG: phage-related protein [Pseudomonadota bacterium]|jgi:hypothetical protein